MSTSTRSWSCSRTNVSTSSLTLDPAPQATAIVIRDIPVQVVRKDIKNLHLGVYPPDGQVRVSAPQHLTDDNIRLAVISRLSWIRKQQAAFQAQPRQSEREMVSGESHYLFGQRYRLAQQTPIADRSSTPAPRSPWSWPHRATGPQSSSSLASSRWARRFSPPVMREAQLL